MSDYFRYEMDVPADGVDINGHVNNVVYVQWMQDAAIRHYYHESGREINAREGATWFVRKHSIEYKRPAFAGDKLAVFTWLVNITAATTQRRYAFVRIADGVVIVRGETEWVFVDAERGRPRHIPKEITARFNEMPEDWLPPLEEPTHSSAL